MRYAAILGLCAACILGLCIIRFRARSRSVGGRETRPYYRIVNLVIYDESSEYERRMQAELRRLLRDGMHGLSIKQLFVSCQPTLASTTHEAGDMLHVQCTESYVPGILQKTLEAMRHCTEAYAFEFLVRSNISTIIDFRRLQTELPATSDALYASSSVFHLDEPDQSFASGTNVILNRRAVEYATANVDYAQFDVPDDVALGEVLRRVTTPRVIPVAMYWNEDNPGGVVFRNRDDAQDRSKDVARMATIVDRIVAEHRNTVGESPIVTRKQR